MRAVKTVITAAGNLKQAEPDADEMVLLLRALQVPKPGAEDISISCSNAEIQHGLWYGLVGGAAQNVSTANTPSFVRACKHSQNSWIRTSPRALPRCLEKRSAWHEQTLRGSSDRHIPNVRRADLATSLRLLKLSLKSIPDLEKHNKPIGDYTHSPKSHKATSATPTHPSAICTPKIIS